MSSNATSHVDKRRAPPPGRTWLTILALFLILPIASVISVAVLYGLAWPDSPDEVFTWGAFDVAEFVPWILGLALFSFTSVPPWLRSRWRSCRCPTQCWRFPPESCSSGVPWGVACERSPRAQQEERHRLLRPGVQPMQARGGDRKIRRGEYDVLKPGSALLP